MTEFEELYKERVEALRRAQNATKCVRVDNLPCLIEEGLFLGSIVAANNLSALKSLNISHVLTIGSVLPLHAKKFKHKIISVPDRINIDISQYFEECFHFIDEARAMGGGVLVHCYAGLSRSVTIITAYLMKKHGMSLSEALQFVKSKRPLAAPNYGFMSQLQNFKKSLQA